MFMKKFLGVLVALTLCFCLFAPAAMAANTSSDILAQLEDLDPEVIKNLSVDDIASMFGISTDTAGDVIQNLGTANGNTSTTGSTDVNAQGGSVLDSLSGLLGGVDLSGITDSLSGGSDVLSTITGMFEGLDTSSFDISGLTDMISGAFSGSGLDLGALTSGLDVGSFDIASILGGLGGSGNGSSAGESGDTASGATDMMAGIMDTLTSGLGALGLDTSMLDGLLDNDIVNFFANLYIGLGEVISPSEDTTTTAAPTTTKPAVVTTTTPKTGDTSAVLVALGTISVASAAAFVCLKKKEN